MGFVILSSDKGMFFDGHEREDVVKARGEFLTIMVECGFLHPSNVPTPEAARAFPSSVPLPLSEIREKTAVLFHDESTFHTNEDQTMWGLKGEHMLRHKSKGSGIMVSDFVDKVNGYLALTDEELSVYRQQIQGSQRKQGDCYFMESPRKATGLLKSLWQSAVAIANVKYPKEEGLKVVWIFDRSSCHKAMAPDALDAAKMNVNPGGKQPKMRDTVWGGKPEKLCFNLGIPKRMKGLERVSN